MSAAPPAKRPRRRLLADYVGLVTVLIGLVLLFGLRSRFFLRASTFTTLANSNADLLVVSVGMTLVLIVGGIDLSVGSVMALSASVTWLLISEVRVPVWAGALACLVVGLVCGLVNGTISVGAGVPSFIVTLGMLEIARGGAYLVTGSQMRWLGEPVAFLGAPLALGVSPGFLLGIALVIMAQLVLSGTVFGRHIVAVGTNEEAVRLSGIDPRGPKVVVFALGGLASGLGGLLSVSRLETADPNGAIGIELSAIAAAVLGGTSLMGGRGSVVGTLLGVLIIAVLQTGLSQVGASEPAKRIVTGAVIVLAVVVDAYRERGSGRFRALLRRWVGRHR
jgi:ribose transport system permease protein